MALRKMTGNKVAVDLQSDVRSDAPSIFVHGPARVFFKNLALRLLGVTGLTSTTEVQAIRTAAAAITDSDEVDWTVEDAEKILAASGSLPLPAYVRVQRMEGAGTILFRVAKSETPKARALTYPPGSARASVSILTALRAEAINIAEGMYMEVPVKLVEDDEGLALAAFFRRGHVHEGSEDSVQATPPTGPGAQAQ